MGKQSILSDYVNKTLAYNNDPVNKLKHNMTTYFNKLNDIKYHDDIDAKQGFHPSHLSKMKCLRREYYRYLGDVKDYIDMVTARRFDNGRKFHDSWQSYFTIFTQEKIVDFLFLGKFTCKNCKKEYNEREHFYQVPKDNCTCGSNSWKYKEEHINIPNLRIEGKIDGVLKFDDYYLLELKSMSPFQFLELYEPLEEHKQQVNLYMLALSKMKYSKKMNIKKAIFIYECKGTHKHKIFNYEYDPKNIEWILEDLKYLNDCLNNNKIPDYKTSSECFNCFPERFNCKI